MADFEDVKRLALDLPDVQESPSNHRPALKVRGNRMAQLTDADLSILGASAPAFATYDAAIRREYAHAPDPAYRVGRRLVLDGFLKRERIYTTPECAELEGQARANLRRAVDELS